MSEDEGGDWVKQLYTDLLKQGWKLPEIDACDILYYIELLGYASEERESVKYIDEVL